MSRLKLGKMLEDIWYLAEGSRKKDPHKTDLRIVIFVSDFTSKTNTAALKLTMQMLCTRHASGDRAKFLFMRDPESRKSVVHLSPEMAQWNSAALALKGYLLRQGLVESDMSKKGNRAVFRRSDGLWVNKQNDEGGASSTHRTQHEAELAARENLRSQGGGEFTTQGKGKGKDKDKDKDKDKNRKFRSRGTIPPGKDPSPPRDREHGSGP